MGNLGQAERIGEFSTPLGQDVLVLTRFSGSEGLGELFEFHIEAVSEQENIDFDPAIGQNCQVKLKAYDGKVRIYNGVMTEARWVGVKESYYHYDMVLRPWFWLLGTKADCRIFLDKNVLDIIKEVFTKDGFTDFEFRTTGSYDTIEYCVQYRESDLAFCCRLMELYGIYYFFEFSDGKHTLVMADSRSSHKPVPDLPQVPFYPMTARELRGQQHLYQWASDRSFRTGKVEFNDYDYLQPKKDLLAPKEASEQYTHSDMELYDYPGKYDEKEKGEKLAQFRLEAEQCLDHRRSVNGDAPSLFPGGLTTVEKHTTASENQEYLVVRASHGFSSEHYLSGQPGREQDQVYYGAFEFLPSDRPFRNLPLTPKPRIYGIQTARVVAKKGEDGEEISTDEHGRIWVQFFWDREPQKTLPIRVAQVWSSKQWGGQFIPRIDMEVVVEFLEGDPDRPLVVGCVFNGDNHYPFTLPDNKTQSGLKSDSSKGHDGYNQIMFEDKKGSEDIVVHAEKDHDVTIKDTETGTIGEAFTSHKGSASRNWTLQQGDDQLDIQVGNQNITLDMGNQTITLDMGSQTVSAMQQITLTVCMGASTIVITPTSISLSSATINLLGDAAINIMAPTVNIGAVLNTPVLNAGTGTVSGIPLI